MAGEGTSEGRYRAIVEEQPEMVCRFRPDGTMTFANEAYARYFGRPPEELVGRRWAPVVHPEDRPAVEAALASLAPAAPVVVVENRVFRADGTVRWTEWTNRAIFDEHGRLLELQATGRDVTERKQAEADAARLSALVASADDAIIAKTLDGVITSWNAAAERLFGWPASEAVGRPISLIVPADRWAEETDMMARIARGEAVRHIETERVSRDGRRIPVSVTLSPVVDLRTDRIIGVSSIARDITERRKAEARLRATVERLDALYRLVDEIARADGVGGICEAAVDAIVRIGADRAAVLLADEAGAMRFVAWRNLSAPYRAAAEGRSPWPPDVQDPKPIVVEDAATDPGLAPVRQAVLGEGIRALLFVPLVNRGRSLGRLMIYLDRPRRFADEDVRLAETIARHLTSGVLRVRAQAAVDRLLAGERLARAEAETAAARFALLAEASRLLASSVDYDRTLEAVLEVALPPIADWGEIYLARRDGTFRRIGPACRDAAHRATARAVREGRYPVRWREGSPVAAQVRAGEPVVVDGGSETWLREHLVGDEWVERFLRLRPRALLLLPLVARGRTIGGLLFALTAGTRRFDDGTVALASELGRRVALAIDHARLYRDAERARAEAEAASRAKDEFLAVLAHELRNPLSVIVNATAIVHGHDALPSELRRPATMIRRQAEHLNRLLDDLLDVARISSGRLELEREPVDLGAVVEQAVDAQRHRVEAKGQRLSVSLPAGPVTVVGDAIRLQQAIGNLVNNAGKYTPAGGSVRVALEVDGGQAVVRVRDDGPGIPPDQLEAIFEPFVQVNPTLARTDGGLGIGLTIVKRLVELHGGSVRAESAGRGSEFVVTLPVSEAPAPRSPSPTGVRPRPRRVLVVEDHDDGREMLAMTLRLDGHQVVEAATGQAAIQAALDHRPEVVLLDIGLPDVQGYEVARRLRETLGGETRLIALTGYGQPHDRARSAAAGFDAHLVKPVDPRTLGEILERLR
jgi:PAS domain S-box-containing protein